VVCFNFRWTGGGENCSSHQGKWYSDFSLVSIFIHWHFFCTHVFELWAVTISIAYEAKAEAKDKKPKQVKIEPAKPIFGNSKKDEDSDDDESDDDESDDDSEGQLIPIGSDDSVSVYVMVLYRFCEIGAWLGTVVMVIDRMIALKRMMRVMMRRKKKRPRFVTAWCPFSFPVTLFYPWCYMTPDTNGTCRSQRLGRRGQLKVCWRRLLPTRRQRSQHRLARRQVRNDKACRQCVHCNPCWCYTYYALDCCRWQEGGCPCGHSTPCKEGRQDPCNQWEVTQIWWVCRVQVLPQVSSPMLFIFSGQ
jgi:hypothetical protein